MNIISSSINWKLLGGLKFLLMCILLGDHLHPYILHPEHDGFYQLRKLTPLSSVIGYLLISGYSIAHSLTQQPQGFYQRRFFRIYPLYFATIFLSLIPFLFLGSEIQLLNSDTLSLPDVGTIAGYLLFLQGLLVGPELSNRPLWVFSVLIVSYLLAPFLIQQRSKVIILLFGISACLYDLLPFLYHKIYQTPFPYYSFLRFELPFMLLSWVWFLGFWYFLNRQKASAAIVLIGLGTIVLFLNQEFTGLWTIIVYLLTSLILIFSGKIQFPGLLLNFLDYLGKISYPLFLLHVPTFTLVYFFLGVRHSISLIFAALLIAICFYHGGQWFNRLFQPKELPS